MTDFVLFLGDANKESPNFFIFALNKWDITRAWLFFFFFDLFLSCLLSKQTGCYTIDLSTATYEMTSIKHNSTKCHNSYHWANFFAHVKKREQMLRRYLCKKKTRQIDDIQLLKEFLDDQGAGKLSCQFTSGDDSFLVT